MESYNNLINHWKKYKPLTGLHPDDFNDKIKKMCVELNNIKDYINLGNYFQDESQLHTGLMPVPYIGDLLNAKIYLLLLNPGFSPQDYHDEADDDFHQAQVATLEQKKLDCPYYPLDPKFCWTSTATWSHRKLGRLIRTYADENKINYLEASKILSKLICSIELFPYHSKIFKGGKDLLNIKSTQLIRAFVKDRINDTSALFIIMRQIKTWGLPDRDNIIKFTSGESRGAHISGDYIKDILEYLEK